MKTERYEVLYVLPEPFDRYDAVHDYSRTPAGTRSADKPWPGAAIHSRLHPRRGKPDLLQNPRTDPGPGGGGRAATTIIRFR